MIGEYIIHNGRLASPGAADFRLDDIDVTYGFGCYEVLKQRDGHLFFPAFHEERLLASAAILGFKHPIEAGMVVAALERLLDANGLRDSNIKIMLIAHEDRPADWYIFQVPPLYPPPEARRAGVSVLVYRGERAFPAAKSLSMLLSTIAFREAKRHGCYDALLLNGRGQFTEGTRTNLFWLDQDRPGSLCTPPARQVLSGITRRTVMAAAREAGWRLKEAPLSLARLRAGRCSLFLTSTSSKILPVSAVLHHGSEPQTLQRQELSVGPEAGRLVAAYDAWLAVNG